MLDSTMHYDDRGERDPIALLQRQPDVIVPVAVRQPGTDAHRSLCCPDLIGMGQSGSSDIQAVLMVSIGER